MNSYLFLIQILIVRCLQIFSPITAAVVFSRLWFKVSKFRPHIGLDSWKSNCEIIEYQHRKISLKAYYRKNILQKGEILFIHGWSGRWDQFFEIAQRLYDDGYSILTFDLPSHGENPNDRSDIFEFAEAIQGINLKKPLDSFFVVCHSAGFLAWSHFCKVHAIPMTNKLVLIACPGNFDYLIEAFSKKLNFNQKLISELWKIIGKKGNTTNPRELLSISHMRSIKDRNVFVVHDKYDKSVSHNEVIKLLQLWPNAALLTTERLGHNRILKSELVVNAISQFIRNEP